MPPSGHVLHVLLSLMMLLCHNKQRTKNILVIVVDDLFPDQDSSPEKPPGQRVTDQQAEQNLRRILDQRAKQQQERNFNEQNCSKSRDPVNVPCSRPEPCPKQSPADRERVCASLTKPKQKDVPQNEGGYKCHQYMYEDGKDVFDHGL